MIKCISNPHERIRVSLDCSSPVLVDQSSKKQCDINNIMAQYAKTGMLPQFRSKEPLYIDETLIPDAITSFNMVNEARELFLELPSRVRKAMDNDPRLMESFLADPENKDFLIKHGVLLERKQPVKESVFSPQDIEILKGLKGEAAQG